MGAGAVKLHFPLDDDTSITSTSIAKCSSPREMSCEACSVNFTLIRRKKPCSDCGRNHCSNCLRKEHSGKAAKQRCMKCRLLTSGTFTRKDLLELSIKDLRHFMIRRKIPMNNCTEKVDLVEILMRTSNNTHYQREQADLQRHHRELEERKRQHAAQFVQHERMSTEGPSAPSSSSEPRQSSEQPSSSNPTQGSRPAQCPPVTIEDIEDDAPDDSSPTTTTDISENPPTIPTEQSLPTQSIPASNPTTSTEVQPSSSPTRRRITTLRDVSDIDSIEQLTVRQLKEILASNYVDYKGCCEKFELVERVRRLWVDKCKERERISSTGEGDLCKICMDAVIDCVLLDCGHMVTCTHCGKQMSECPICRQFVVRVIHVFKA